VEANICGCHGGPAEIIGHGLSGFHIILTRLLHLWHCSLKSARRIQATGKKISDAGLQQIYERLVSQSVNVMKPFILRFLRLT